MPIEHTDGGDRDSGGNSGALVPVERPRLPRIVLPRSADDDPAAPETGLGRIAHHYDVKAMSPREMVHLSHDLYMSGHVDREQYYALAFQSELMPNFDRTIGALTGERAAPDRPRDYTTVWKKRLRFEMDHCPDDQRIIRRTRRILDLLLSLRPPRKRRAPENPLARARRPGRRPEARGE